FKENVPDLRNSKVVDMLARLRALGHQVAVHDACADAAEARHEYGETLLPGLDGAKDYDCVVGAVPHAAYAGFDAARLTTLVKKGGIVADLKGMWRALTPSPAFTIWRP